VVSVSFLPLTGNAVHLCETRPESKCELVRDWDWKLGHIVAGVSVSSFLFQSEKCVGHIVGVRNKWREIWVQKQEARRHCPG